MEAPIHADFKGLPKNLLIIVNEQCSNEVKWLYFLQRRNFFGEKKREVCDVFFRKIKPHSCR